MMYTRVIAIVVLFVLFSCGQNSSSGEGSPIVEKLDTTTTSSDNYEANNSSILLEEDNQSQPYDDFKNKFPLKELPIELNSNLLKQYWRGSPQATYNYLGNSKAKLDRKYYSFLNCTSPVFSKDNIPEQDNYEDLNSIDNYFIPVCYIKVSDKIDAFVVMVSPSPKGDPNFVTSFNYQLFLFKKLQKSYTKSIEGNHYMLINCFTLNNPSMREFIYPETVKIYRDETSGLLTYSSVDNLLNTDTKKLAGRDTTLVYISKDGGVQDYSTTVEADEP